MTIYDDLRPVVTDVMREFKQGTVYYVAVTPGAGPADDPGAPTETLTEIDAAVRGAKFKYVQNGLAVASDMQATFGAEVVTPAPNGFIQVDGTRYKIQHILPKPAAGTPVAYTLIIRKGS